MEEMFTQTEEGFASGCKSGGEERNRCLEMLVCDLLQKNQELRFEMPYLYGRDQVSML